MVFVALKANSLTAAAPRLGPLLAPGRGGDLGAERHAVVVLPGPAQPGGQAALESVDPGGEIAAAIRPEHNVGCVVYCAHRDHRARRHPAHRGHPVHDRRARRLGQRALPGDLGGVRGGRPEGAGRDPSLRDQIWLKLVGNVAFNPITALTRATLGELGTIPEMVDLLREMFAECAAVADRLGIEFPVSLDRRLEAGLAVGDHQTSMLQDLEAGKRLELDCMTGAVVELADRMGVDVPHIRTVHACARLLDHLAAQR